MSLNRVEEELPLFISELTQFSDQLRKNIGVLTIEAEKAQASQAINLQQQIMQILRELQDNSDKLSIALCGPLADALMIKQAQLKSYLYE